MTGSLLAEELSCSDRFRVKDSRGIANCAMPPLEPEPMSHTSVALTPQYLKVRQRKRGTIIIQTVRVHILQLNSADTGSLPMDDFIKHIPNYFQ
jgi:hypothetical protein